MLFIYKHYFYILSILYFYTIKTFHFSKRGQQPIKKTIWECAVSSTKLWQNTPSQTPALFSPSLQPNLHISPPFYSPDPSPQDSPGRGCCSLLIWLRPRGIQVLPFLPPESVTVTFSPPSFLTLSQWGFNTLHCIYSCVQRSFEPRAWEWCSLCPLNPSAAFILFIPPSTSPLDLSVHLTPHLHKILLAAALRYPHCQLLDTTSAEVTKTTKAGSVTFFHL